VKKLDNRQKQTNQLRAEKVSPVMKQMARSKDESQEAPDSEKTGSTDTGAKDGQRIEPYHAPQKIGRNDPCPCGSGKKYKKCCLTKEST